MTGISGSRRALRIPPVQSHPAIKTEKPAATERTQIVPPEASSNPLHLYGSLVNGVRVLGQITPGLLKADGYHGNLQVVRSMLAEMMQSVKRLIEIEEGD